MHLGKQVDPGARVLEGRFRDRIGDPPGMQQQQAGDLLQVVADPVADLGQQELTLAQEGAFLREGGGKLVFPLVLALGQGFELGRIDLDDIVGSGFDELINNKEENVKILVRP